MGFKKGLSLLLLTCSLAVSAGETLDAGTNILDIVFYRPLGLAATLAGTGLLVGIAPLTAFASISPPHDAVYRAAGILVVAPAKFTFDRPLGVFKPDADGEYRR